MRRAIGTSSGELAAPVPGGCSVKAVQQLHSRVERVFTCSTEVGESPLWDAGRQRLYWVDIPAGRVYSGDPATGRIEMRASASTVGSLALCRTGGLLVATGAHLEMWPCDLTDTGTELVAPMPVRPEPSRFNDGKAGPDGRFWVGTLDARPDRQAVGAVHGLAREGTPVLLMSQLLVPNGIAWSPEGDRMVFADSRQAKVWSLPFDPNTGPLAAPQPWLDWRADTMGLPDGAAMDAEGCYWICAVFSSRIHRFDRDGVHIESYTLPVTQPTMCCFGGADLKTLYVTSMTTGLDTNQRALQPLAGTVIAFQVTVPGWPVGKFG